MSRVLPRDVRMALTILEADPGRKLSTRELAAACGVAPRTLQKHFRRFLDGSPHAVQARLRMERARRALLSAPPDASVTAIALRCGFPHLGRFAGAYAQRYGESPSATLRARRSVPDTGRLPYRGPISERPSVGVAPFTCADVSAPDAVLLAEGVAAALSRKPWLSVIAPGRARYRLRGTLQADEAGRHRVVLMLADAASGRHLWADRWDGAGDAFAFQDRVADGVASAVERVVRSAEIDEARGKPIADLDAWHLTMRALPDALLIDPAAQARALELLERAMALAPEDALPPAFAAWCHGQRAGHGFTAAPAAEKQAARALAGRAAQRGHHDAVVQALVGAAYTLAHELGAAAHHLARALALDPACVWAWNRSGWVSLYEGRAADAIEQFHIARTIAPDDELSFYCTIGIAAAHFEAGRYAEAARWYARGLVEHPSATWVNRFLAPSQALAGMKDQARHSVAELSRGFPGLTIAEVTSALPNTPGFLARQAEGLEAAGLRP